MKKQLRIGLDVDGVLACFSQGVIDRAKTLGYAEHFPKHHTEITYWGISEKFAEVMKGAWLSSQFWMGLEPMLNVLPLPLNPYAYITSRPISGLVTKDWLTLHGFPEAPVITVDHPIQKLSHAIDMKLDLYIDDLHHTVRDMRNAGVNALLYSAPYHSSPEADCEGLPIITSLEEALQYVK